jgi:hypothetical protein
MPERLRKAIEFAHTPKPARVTERSLVRRMGASIPYDAWSLGTPATGARSMNGSAAVVTRGFAEL